MSFVREAPRQRCLHILRRLFSTFAMRYLIFIRTAPHSPVSDVGHPGSPRLVPNRAAVVTGATVVPPVARHALQRAQSRVPRLTASRFGGFCSLPEPIAYIKADIPCITLEYGERTTQIEIETPHRAGVAVVVRRTAAAWHFQVRAGGGLDSGCIRTAPKPVCRSALRCTG